MTAIQGLSLSFSCSKTTTPLTQTTSSGLANEIEKIKRDQNIGNMGEHYPVTFSVQNESCFDAKDIHIKLDIILTCPDMTQFSVEISSPLPDIGRDQSLKRDLFDLSGFSEGLITLLEFRYKLNGINPLPTASDSFLVNIDELNNSFNGYRNYEEMQTSILLQTYIRDSFSARGLLLKFTLNNLRQINNNKGFEYEGKKFSLHEGDLSVIRSMIQIDVIAKIMTYIEDLIILLEAIRESDGNYYLFLDKRSSQYQKDNDMDVGERIGRFFYEKEFSDEDWMEMLSYAKVNGSNMETSKKELIQKLMELNIAEFRKLISKIKDFENTHRPVFRRYKHAGFPIKLGAKSESGTTGSNSSLVLNYSMVFVGKDPLRDIIPLPYSEEIIESYRILIHGLQYMIKDVVQNKMECIRRRTEGIIPIRSYSLPDTFDSEQNSRIVSIISEFDTKNPSRAFNDSYTFPINAVNEMKWYKDLESNMREWKRIKSIQDQSD